MRKCFRKFLGKKAPGAAEGWRWGGRWPSAPLSLTAPARHSPRPCPPFFIERCSPSAPELAHWPSAHPEANPTQSSPTETLPGLIPLLPGQRHNDQAFSGHPTACPSVTQGAQHATTASHPPSPSLGPGQPPSPGGRGLLPPALSWAVPLSASPQIDVGPAGDAPSPPLCSWTTSKAGLLGPQTLRPDKARCPRWTDSFLDPSLRWGLGRVSLATDPTALGFKGQRDNCQCAPKTKAWGAQATWLPRPLRPQGRARPVVATTLPPSGLQGPGAQARPAQTRDDPGGEWLAGPTSGLQTRNHSPVSGASSPRSP